MGWTGPHSVWGAWLRTRKRNCGEVEYCSPPNAAATPLQDSKPTRDGMVAPKLSPTCQRFLLIRSRVSTSISWPANCNFALLPSLAVDGSCERDGAGWAIPAGYAHVPESLGSLGLLLVVGYPVVYFAIIFFAERVLARGSYAAAAIVALLPITFSLFVVRGLLVT